MNQPAIEPSIPNASPARIGRSAALIHALALLSALAAWIGNSLRDAQTAEAIFAIGGVAALIFLVWSLLLAVRSLQTRERVTWPGTVLIFVLMELSAFLVVLWLFPANFYLSESKLLEFAIDNALPVFAPVFALATALAAPLGLWRTRRAEALKTESGGEPWATRKIFKAWLLRYCLMCVLIGGVLLPVPLFIYGMINSRFYSYNDSSMPPQPKEWPAKFSHSMPHAFCDGVDSLLSISDSEICTEIRKQILSYGRVTKNRLLKYVKDSIKNSELASESWHGLKYAYADDALNIAYEIAAKKPLSLTTASRCGQIIGEHGSPEHIRRFLYKPSTPAETSFQNTLLMELRGNKRRSELVKDVEQYSQINSANRDYSAWSLFAIASDTEMPQLWSKYVNDPDPEFQQAALSFLGRLQPDYRILNTLVNHADKNIRDKGLAGLAYFVFIERRKTLPEHQVARWVNSLYLMLNEGEAARMSAMCLLHHFCDDNKDDHESYYIGRADSLFRWYRQGSSFWVRDTTDENELKRIRAVTEKWINSH